MLLLIFILIIDLYFYVLTLLDQREKCYLIIYIIKKNENDKFISLLKVNLIFMS